MAKYFPIKTATACQLKWTWSTIHLYTGETNSCHRVGATVVNDKNFNSFHNTPKKIDDRKKMLAGEWPEGGCEYCKDIEQSGGMSDRQFQLQIPDLSPPELDVDVNAVEVTPRILEIYLDNVCNMSCIYCWDGFSSKIQQENIRFGDFKKGDIEIKNYAKPAENIESLTESFWQWMEQNSQSLRRFHILGGEPFFQQSFERCLEFLESHHHPDLEFNIISNLKVNPKKLEKHIIRIHDMIMSGKIKRFDLTCSIDCWGDEQEYIRYGIDMEEWQRNFDYVARQKWITLNINQTITGLGVKSIPNLLKFINQYRRDREIGHYFMSCVNRPHLYPGIFGQGFFDDDIDKILANMPCETWQQKNAKEMMLGIQKEWNSKKRDHSAIQSLGIFLDEMDRRRNLNWRKTFPWLEKEMNDVV